MTTEEAKAWLECIEFEVAPHTQKALIVAIGALKNQEELKKYNGEFVYIKDNKIHPCTYSQDADYDESEIIADLN